MVSVALDISRFVGSVAPELPPLSATVYGVVLVHCTVVVPLASVFAAITPTEPKLTAVADTRQLAGPVAVQVVVPPLVVLLPVGQADVPLLPYLMPGDVALQ